MGRPFEIGNKHGGKRKEKMFYDALMLAIKDTVNAGKLRSIADKLLSLAAEGDIQAIKEVANRLDGMPTVQIDQTIENISYVAELPQVAETSEEWMKQNQEMTPTKFQ
jgi:hypothetical protein